MRIGKATFLILLFLLSMSLVCALDEVDRVYFQQQMEKLTAQTNSKIDTQTNRIEAELKTSVDTARNQILTEMTDQIKGSLKAVAIGLSGLIVITLAIFKVIDLKISSTRNIRKYETLVQQKTEELNQLILQATVERNELNNLRVQLMEYQKRLQNWDKQLQSFKSQSSIPQYQSPPNIQFQQPQYQQPQPQFQQQPLQIPNAPQEYLYPPQTKKKSGWKSFAMFVLGVVVLIMIGLIVYKFLIAP